MRSSSAVESSPPAPSRTRRRLSRTLARARWPEYGRLLKAAIGAGYAVSTLEQFLDDPGGQGERPVLVLRHDVDQHPASALVMAEMEAAVGVQATWYFRWRTAEPRVIARVRAQGGEVGLHYETLTRRTLAAGGAVDLEACRRELRAEVAAFRARFGPLHSICAHGDTRVPGVRNLDLVQDVGPESFGVPYDANLSLRTIALGAWLTDRSVAEGRWLDGMDPFALIAARTTPLLCLTHPNNWTSGPSLWWDRALAAVLPAGARGVTRRIVRTGRDEPPL